MTLVWDFEQSDSTHPQQRPEFFFFFGIDVQSSFPLSSTKEKNTCVIVLLPLERNELWCTILNEKTLNSGRLQNGTKIRCRLWHRSSILYLSLSVSYKRRRHVSLFHCLTFREEKCAHL